MLKRQVEALLVSVDGNLQCHFPDPDLLNLANKSSLVSAMTNLISNAVEATGQGARLFISAQRRGDKWMEISVMDNGPGIEKGQLEKVMEAFYTTKSQGTGLGLAVVQSIAQAHKGSVEVKSEFGKGSCFTLVLPLHRVGEQQNLLGKVVGG